MADVEPSAGLNFPAALLGHPATVRGVAAVLREQGFALRVLCGDASEAEALRDAVRPPGGAGLEPAIVGGAPSEPEALEELLRGARGAVLLSPVDLHGRLWRPGSHLEDVRRVIERAEAAGVQRLVYLSAPGANPKALARCLREAAEAEQLGLRSRLIEYSLRASPLLGGGEDVISWAAARAARPLPFMLVWGYGDTRIRPLHLRDLGACVARCLTVAPAALAPGAYDVGGDRALTVLELLDGELARRRRFKIKVHVPLFLLRLAASLAPGRKDGADFAEKVNLALSSPCAEVNDLGRLLGPGYRSHTLLSSPPGL
jgi:NADH dehydrogenase